MKASQMPRRQFLKTSGAILATIPIVVVSGRADAATNAAVRAGLKYQGTPEGDKSCANCMQFVAPSSCKLIPGHRDITSRLLRRLGQEGLTGTVGQIAQRPCGGFAGPFVTRGETMIRRFDPAVPAKSGSVSVLNH